jgi:hypothetical protein
MHFDQLKRREFITRVETRIAVQRSDVSFRRLRTYRRGLLCRFSARGHRSEIMLGVLVVVFCPDYIAGLGLGLG